jgi:hypothetical protein
MVIITKENKKNYNVAGTFSVVGLDNQIILKNNGQPWSGRTTCMSNYYGVIVGAGKYAAVKSQVVWQPDYRILFSPDTESLEPEVPAAPVMIIQDAGENRVLTEEEIKDMEKINIQFKYNNATLPAHIGVQFYEDDDVYVECKLGDNGDEWKKAWFSDIEDWKKYYKASDRLQDLYNALEKSILEALPSEYKYDPDMIFWDKVLTEGKFAMTLGKK